MNKADQAGNDQEPQAGRSHTPATREAAGQDRSRHILGCSRAVSPSAWSATRPASQPVTAADLASLLARSRRRVPGAGCGEGTSL